MLLLDVSVSHSDQVNVLSLILLGQCGLPGPFGLITAGALLICRLVRSLASLLSSSSFAVMYARVGYMSTYSPA